MLFGNSNIKKLLRVYPGKLLHTRANRHSRSNSYKISVSCSSLAQPFTKTFRVGYMILGNLSFYTAFRIKGWNTVILGRIIFCRLIALSLFGNHVYQLQTADFFYILQQRDQSLNIMTINRTDIVKAQLLKQSTRHNHALNMFLSLFCQ